MELSDILRAAVEGKASDLIPQDQPPMVRHGENSLFCRDSPHGHARVSRVIMSSLYDEQRRILQETLELDCSFTMDNVGRFRVNVTTSRTVCTLSSALSRRKSRLEDLNLPEAVRNISSLNKGWCHHRSCRFGKIHHACLSH